MKRISQNFKGHVPQLVMGPLFKLFEAILELFVPLVVADIIDVGVPSGDTGYILSRGLILLALAIGGVVMALICQYFAAVVAGWFGRGLRKQIYAHVMKLGGNETAEFGAGGLITRITNDTNQIQNGVNMFIRLGTRAPFLIIGGLAMALRLNLKMGLIFLAAMPVLGVILYVIMKITLPSYGRIQQKQDELARLSGENLAGARVIRAFSRAEDEQKELDAAASDLQRIMVRVGRVSAALNPLTNIIATIAIAALVWVGGGLSFSGQSTPGEVIAMVSYVNQVVLAMVIATNLIVLFTRAAASVKRVNELLAVEPSITDGNADCLQFIPTEGGDKLTNTALKGNHVQEVQGAPAVEFNDVMFAYHEGADEALEHVSFTVAKGETLGIIGGTGSGKSTLVNLIMRYFDVQCGSVSVNGCDVRKYNLHTLRKKIGLVAQQAEVFSGTIAENLRVSAPDASEEDMWEALRAAQAESFVMEKEGGLQTEIVEGGKNLSGGQRQRISIARALVRKPELLILDDAASALDFATDAKLRKTLGAMCREKQMTVIMISQRAASIRHSNRILVMDDGHIAATGSHEELIENNDIYREICASQGIRR